MDNSSLTLAARPTFVSSGEPVFRLMYLILVSIATTFGNLLVLVAILKFKALRRATNAMLGSLAVADLLVGTVTVPLYILWTAKPGVFDESLFMCGFVLFSCLLVVTASQLNLLVMSVEHYLAVCWPLRHRDVLIRCPWLHAVAVSVIWILSLLTTVLSSFAFNKDTKTCSYYGSFDKTFLFSASIAGIFFPFIAIIVLNIKVLYEVKEHDKRRSVSVDRPSGRYRNSVSSFYSSKTDPSSESNKGDQELSSSHKATCLKKSKKPRRQRSFGKYTHVNIEEDNESSVFYPSNPKQSPIFESKSHVSRSRTRTSAPISLKRKTGLESLSFNTGGYPIDSVFTTPVTTTIATTATLTTNATQSTTLTLGSRSSSSGDQGYADVSDNSDSNNDTSIVCDMGADGSFHTKSQNDSPNAKDKTQVTRNSLDGDPYNIKSKMVPIDKTQLPHKLTGEDETLISVMNTFESIPKDEKQNINFLFTTNDGDKKSDGQEIEPKYDKNENKIAFYLFKDSIEADVLPESENESNLYEDLRLETLTGSPISCCNHKEVSPEHTEATPICRIPHSYSDSTCLVCHETVNVQAHPSSLSKGDTCSADQVNVGTPFKHQDNGQSKSDEFDTKLKKQNQDVKTHHGSIKRKIHQEKSNVYRTRSRSAGSNYKSNDEQPELGRKSRSLSVFLYRPRKRCDSSTSSIWRPSNLLRRLSTNPFSGKSENSTPSSHVSGRVAKMVALVCVSFILAWFPFFIVIMINMFCERCHLTYYLNAVIMVAFTKSVSNPIIYALCHVTFRRTYSKVLASLCFIKIKKRRNGSAFDENRSM